jgi:hypothetical protein
VMDNRGSLVGTSALTSDYYQGDEDKWNNSFADCRGGVDIGVLQKDASVGVIQQQISFPLLDASNRVVGAVTWGVLTFIAESQLHWVEPSSAVGAVTVTIGLLGVVFGGALLVMLFLRRKRRAIQAVSAPFLGLQALGAVVGNSIAFLHLQEPTAFICNTRIWMLGKGAYVTCMLVCVCVYVSACEHFSSTGVYLRLHTHVYTQCWRPSCS